MKKNHKNIYDTEFILLSLRYHNLHTLFLKLLQLEINSNKNHGAVEKLYSITYSIEYDGVADTTPPKYGTKQILEKKFSPFQPLCLMFHQLMRRFIFANTREILLSRIGGNGRMLVK